VSAEPVVERRTYAGLFMVTLATLMFEILLTRIFSVTMFYHFAFFAISVAMFGMTIGALLVYRMPERFKDARRQMASASLAFSISIVFSFFTHLSIPFVFHGSLTWLFSLALNYVVLALPFACSGIVVCLALTKFPAQVGKLYAADLAGAAVGCLLVVWTLNVTDGPTAVVVVAFLASVGTVLLAPDGASRRFRRTARVTAVALLSFALLQTALVRKQASLLRPMWVKGNLEPRPLYEAWNSFSRITVIGDTKKSNLPERRPFGWGLSSTLPDGEKVPQLALYIDAAAGTVLTKFDGDLEPLDYLRYDITNLVHHARPGGSVFLVGAGGGRDILSALVFGQKSIVATEVNEDIVKTVSERFGDFTGHLDRIPAVRLVPDEARSFLARDHRTYDAIQISFIDTWAATASGAFVLAEHQLYTVEAFSLFLKRLKPGGILSVSRWHFRDLPGELYRVTALANASLRATGVGNPRAHLFAATHTFAGTPWWSLAPLPEGVGVGTVLIGRDPFSGQDLKRLTDATSALAFDVALTPTSATDESLASLASADDPSRWAASFPLDVSPPTDDAPFFFQMMRFRDMFQGKLYRQGVNTPNMIALLILGALLLVVLALTSLCILFPLFVATGRKALRGSWALTVFFGAIGLGFMLVEVALLQRLTVFLGHPTYGLTVVLFTLLLSAGLGSSLTERATVRPQRPWPLVAIPLVLMAAGSIIPWLTTWFQGLDNGWRMAIAAVVTFPMGLVMGTAFPVGMKLAAARAPTLASWLWGINGAASVCASVLAVTIALGSSISGSFLCGVASYLLALAAFAASLRVRSSPS
jgi:hypothetical protein